MADDERAPLKDLPSRVARVLSDFVAAAQAALAGDLRASSVASAHEPLADRSDHPARLRFDQNLPRPGARAA